MYAQKIKKDGTGELRTPAVEVVIESVLSVRDEQSAMGDVLTFQFFREQRHVFVSDELIVTAVKEQRRRRLQTDV